MASAAERVVRVIADRLAIEPEACARTASLRGDLGADDVDMVEIVAALEEEFTRALSETAVERLVTVGDAIALFEGRDG